MSQLPYLQLSNASAASRAAAQTADTLRRLAALERRSTSAANGVPVGGTAGQLLEKNSSTDYDSKWSTVGTVPSGGSAGQVLTKDSSTDYDTSWTTASGTPDATTSTKGVVQLAGDLAGTAASPQIASGAIVDADVNSGAKIGISKLSLGSSGQIIVANSSGVPTYVTPSGDVSVTTAGATAVNAISNPMVVAYRSSTQSFANNTDERVTWEGTNEDYSTAFWSSGSATRLTIPTGQGGLYLMTFHVTFAGNATGDRYAFIWANGADFSSPYGTVIRAPGTFAGRFSGTFVNDLSAGTYIQLNCRQNSGGALNLVYAQMSLMRIRA